MPYLRLNGLEIIQDIAEIKWSENDLDSPKAGRTLEGKMHRGKVTSTRKAEIKLINLKASTVNRVLAILRNEYFKCQTDLVPASSAVTMEMYNSTRSGGIQIITTDNVVMHQDVSFNIIER